MPTVTLDYTNTKIHDTIVQAANPDNNYVNGQTMTFGTLDVLFSLLKPVLGVIPNNCVINSATLYLVTQNTGPITCEVRGVLSDFDPATVTWNTKPAYGIVLSTSVTPAGNSAATYIDIKDVIQGMVDGKYFGIAINSVTGSQIFGTAENTTPSYRPKITIDYTLPTTDKKYVEFIDKSSAFLTAAGAGLDIPVPSNKNIGDMLVAYIQCGGNTSSPITVPTGWTALSLNENINSGSYFMSILYKISDGTETVFQVRPGAGSYINGSVHVYRNVKAIYDHGPLRYAANNTQQYPNPPTDLLSNRLLVTFIASLSSTSGTPPLSFLEESDIAGSGITNIISHAYNHSKTTYTTSELITTLTAAYNAGSKAISLEPITNEAPKIDGKDEFLGSQASPLIKPYTVTDTENNVITITEKLNGNVIRSYQGTSAQTLNLTPQWASLPLGKHTVTIEVNDDYNNPPHPPTVRTWTFLKILPTAATLLETVTGTHQVVPYLQSQKAIMGNVLRGKGIMVNDTDRLEVMALALANSTAVGRKRSGSVTSELGTLVFKYTTDATLNLARIIVTGLPFKPSIILAFCKQYGNAVIYTNDYDKYYNPTAKVFSYTDNSSSSASYNVKGVSPLVVNDTGFTLPVINAGADYTWIAIE